MHWHGVALRNDMDGVPASPRSRSARGPFHYEFTAPTPGTYFYHPHSGVQLDRGLYGVLVVDDPTERGDYDDEWVVVLDDWVDGTGRTPDAGPGAPAASPAAADTGDVGDGTMVAWVGHGSMGGWGGWGMQSPLLGGAGDVDYPYFLVNGRAPTAPVV